MSHLQYFAYKGVGERNQQKFRYSQAVRIGDRIECAGQGEHIARLRYLPSFTLLIPKKVDGTVRLEYSTAKSTLKLIKHSPMSNIISGTLVAKAGTRFSVSILTTFLSMMRL